MIGFERLYDRLGLRWSDAVAGRIARLNGEGNRTVIPDGDRGGVVRDSRAAAWTWTGRLSPEEIERVRMGTADVASRVYSADDWLPGQSVCL